MTAAARWLLGAAVVALLGCDTLLVDPAPAGPVQSVPLGFFVPTAVPADDFSHVMAQVRWVRFRLESGEGARDTVAEARFDDGAVRVHLGVRQEEATGWLQIQAELLSSRSAPLFVGQGLVHAYSIAPELHLEVTPVAATIAVPASAAMLTALGDTLTLIAHPVFATGDTITGATVAWSSPSPELVDVVEDDRAVARGNGHAILTGSALGARVRRTVIVTQVPASFTGVEPADTTVSVAMSFQLRLFGQDGNGFPLLPGAGVLWSTSGGIRVDDRGRVTAEDIGTGYVEATVGALRHTAYVTVLP